MKLAVEQWPAGGRCTVSGVVRPQGLRGGGREVRVDIFLTARDAAMKRSKKRGRAEKNSPFCFSFIRFRPKSKTVNPQPGRNRGGPGRRARTPEPAAIKSS